MIDWARERCPVAVLRPGNAGELSDCIDLDAELASVESATLAPLLKGKKAARGAILATPDAARQAAACGIKTMVTEPILPALLAILCAAQ
jgi:hypothetical protein